MLNKIFKLKIQVESVTSLTLNFGQTLEAEMTGRYEFTARRKDGSTQIISWYIYFYPGKYYFFSKQSIFFINLIPDIFYIFFKFKKFYSYFI